MRNHQTLSFIRRQLARHGLRPNTGLGQHFLIDGNLLHLMVEKAAVGEGDLILEVGAGTGSLTQLLARRAGHVIAVELDARLLDMAQRALVRYDNVTVWHGDVLANKHTLAPELVRLVREVFDAVFPPPLQHQIDLPRPSVAVAAADVSCYLFVPDVVSMIPHIPSLISPMPAPRFRVYPVMVATSGLLKVHIPFTATVNPKLRMPAAKFFNDRPWRHHATS